MKDYVTLSFGLVIAFIVPGMIFAVGLAAFSPEATEAITRGSSVFAAAALLAVAAGGGVFIAGLRELTLDRRFEGSKHKPLDFSGLRNESTLKAFRAVVEDYWNYYCFFGGTLVAVPV